jgi:taurine dehydrogenase small subunit
LKEEAAMARSTDGEQIERYFAAFNAHDLEGVMACFHDRPVIVGSDGSRYEGTAAIRSLYAEQFAIVPDGRCELRALVGSDGHGAAESFFHGTRSRDGRPIKALGVEMFELMDGRIREIRVYHRSVE